MARGGERRTEGKRRARSRQGDLVEVCLMEVDDVPVAERAETLNLVHDRIPVLLEWPLNSLDRDVDVVAPLSGNGDLAKATGRERSCEGDRREEKGGRREGGEGRT